MEWSALVYQNNVDRDFLLTSIMLNREADQVSSTIIEKFRVLPKMENLKNNALLAGVIRDDKKGKSFDTQKLPELSKYNRALNYPYKPQEQSSKQI